MIVETNNNTENFETGCCPRFNPENWHEKEIIFKDKLFLKDHVISLFHIPFNFSKVMEKSMAKIEKAGAMTKEQIVLSDENSLFGSDVYIAVEKEVPQAEMKKISGTFLAKVFEGSYNNMSAYIEQMKTFVQSKGKKSEKLYFFYPYCPNCAKAYRKNYIVILAQV